MPLTPINESRFCELFVGTGVVVAPPMLSTFLESFVSNPSGEVDYEF